MFAQESVMEIQKEREAFEAWYRKEYDNTVIDDSEFSEILGEYESNYYWVDELNQSWMAWQAAKGQAAPEGFLLMPRKCTNKMAHAANAVDGRLSAFKYADVYDAMIEAQEQSHECQNP